MLRTLLVFSILSAFTVSAAAQTEPVPPSAYVVPAAPAPAALAAPVAPAAAYEAAPALAAPAPVVEYSAFPPHDRRGRVLIGTRQELQTDRGLWGAGLGLFLAGWVIDIVGTAIFNAVSDDRDGSVEEDAMAWSLVPWVGPMIQLGLEAPHPALPIMTGLLQITGTVLFVLGVTSQNETEVPIYGRPGTASLGFDIAPTDGGAYAALTLHTM